MMWYRLALIVVILDQLTKRVVTLQLDYGVPIKVLPVLDITLQHNTGAAFSFLHDAGGWQRWLFAGIAALVSVALAVWMHRLRRDQYLLLSGLALILGGAVGNLIDRMRFGYVIDFIAVHWHEHYFPAFNVADSAITIGAGLLLLDMLLNPHNHGKATAQGNTHE